MSTGNEPDADRKPEIAEPVPPEAGTQPPWSPGRLARLHKTVLARLHKTGKRLHKTVKEIEPWGILVAAVALFLSLVGFWIDYSDRVEERTVRAWQLLTTRAPGNSGKIAALEYLNSEDGLICREWLSGRLDWLHDQENVGCLVLLKARTPLPGIDLSPPDDGHPGAYLVAVKLRRANLTGADLTGADLGSADLTGAVLRDANVPVADLTGADLGGAYLGGADMSGANLGSADLTGANLTGANLTGANLRGADLAGAFLPGADMSGANLSGAAPRPANLVGAVLRDATLRYATLRHADLAGANLAGANLRHSDLTGAYLGGADMSGADMSGADMSGANLSGTKKLEQGQLNAACGDPEDPPRNLPDGLEWHENPCEE